MKTSRAVLIVLGLLLSGAISNQLSAQTHNLRTKVTFSHPVSIPGQVLPAGTYIFTIADMKGSRNVVLIWNDDKTKQIATVKAIAAYRLKPGHETVIEFNEGSSNAPPAIKAWFYPGWDHGLEFIYPKQEATQIAAASNEDVPADTGVVETPKGGEEPISKDFPDK